MALFCDPSIWISGSLIGPSATLRFNAGFAAAASNKKETKPALTQTLPAKHDREVGQFEVVPSDETVWRPGQGGSVLFRRRRLLRHFRHS
ncbi:MAG TPA: hypothetical protein PLI43_14435, partial [Albidovulum sp.]|uniref:hypothetical protein n=1 Tax=Albidovulum sp. TaxID=1872424 RepID=UPI002C30D22F|nr:hypothetical protein [Albidovulum sp.]